MTKPKGRSRDDSTSGAYFEDIKSVSNPITREEEQELFQRYRDGDEEAGEQIILANLRFVISVAQQYSSSMAPLEDLISEGNMGLLTALDHFDHTKGNKFISYAVWWIKQRIRAYLKEDHIVRRPGNIHDAKTRTFKAQHELGQMLDREATLDDIAEYLDVDTEKVAHTMPSQWAMVYTDDHNDKTIVPTTTNNYATEADISVEEEERKKIIREMINSSLSEREQYVLIRSFGLDGGPGMTLDKIGKSLGLTRERIRQIREVALMKLKSKPIIRSLGIK